MLSLMIAAAFAMPLPPPTPDPAMNLEAVRKVVCDYGTGTAFVVAPNTLATADHVVEAKNCKDAATGQKLFAYHRDGKHDFALVTMDTGDIVPIKYSCRRFRTSGVYYSYGYGRGTFMQNRLVASKAYTDDKFLVRGMYGLSYAPGMREFEGIIIGGQSGGPIVDDYGIAHGINNAGNAYGKGWSYELADTELCNRGD